MDQANTDETARRDGSALQRTVGHGPQQTQPMAAMDALAEQALSQMDKARDFPNNTCGASRHVALLAEAILRGEPCPQLTDEPQHCAESMAWTVAALWNARTELAMARSELEQERSRLAALCDRARADFAQDQHTDAFSHGFRSACALLKQAVEKPQPNV